MTLTRNLALIGILLGLLDSIVAQALNPLGIGSATDVAFAALLASTAWILGLWLCVFLVGFLMNLVPGWDRREHVGAISLVAGFLVTIIVGTQLIDDLDSRALLGINKHLARSLMALAGILIGSCVGLVSRAPRASRILIPAVLLLAVLAIPKTGGTSQASTGTRKNIVLISIDTLRADHLSLYGYERETTPNIDSFSGAALVFENAISASHWTLPSHAALLTGLNPVALGILDKDDFLASAYETLAETLGRNGWHTAAFVGLDPYSYIGEKRGFGQGFDVYEHAPYFHPGMESLTLRGLSRAWSKKVNHDIGVASSQLGHVERWFKSRPAAPFFLFLHLFDVHSDTYHLPYDAPGEFRERFSTGVGMDLTGCNPAGLCASELLIAYANGDEPDKPSDEHIQRMIDLYDGGIAYVDAQLGRLFEVLDKQGLLDSTTVIITSDHGEAFFEHGVPLHTNLHRENLHVPLIIVDPDVKAGRVTSAVQNMDVMPTVLELLGLGSEERSLTRAIHPAKDGRAAFSASGEQLGWTTTEEKLILPWDGMELEEPRGAEALYFHLTDDLQERFAVPSDDAAGLIEALVTLARQSLLVRSVSVPPEDREKVNLSEKQREALRKLGYAE